LLSVFKIAKPASQQVHLQRT